MAEGRMLKKLVSTSRKLADLKTDSARLLWTWILPHVDIKGRFSAEPDIVKGSIVPRLKTMTTTKIANYLLDMAANDMILLYKYNGDMYLEIVKFEDFQTLREDREAGSIIPPPDAADTTPGVPTDNSGLSQDKSSQAKPREDKPREIKATDKSSLESGGLGLSVDIKGKAVKFVEELEKVFPRISRDEATTLARVAQHLSDEVRLGAPIGIFDDALGWAKESMGGNVRNPKGLFVAKVKEQTGFTGRGKLLK